MTLYEITGELLALQNMLEDEDPDIVEATMESVEFDLEEKAEGYVKVIRNLEANAAALREEEKRLREKRHRKRKMQKQRSSSTPHLTRGCVRERRKHFLKR